ncbi:hypothetical protein GCM10010269_26360 [Streptomyces humidus]|uniref:Uncharacterized protein n=1 Tax=Streptomyces humidus TaxID=52259 RepID=A0A918FVQ5_9ACTN|nr:hypothetical protein GCM10010269_26360 [Streptomyces humidus]
MYVCQYGAGPPTVFVFTGAALVCTEAVAQPPTAPTGAVPEPVMPTVSVQAAVSRWNES